MTSKFDYVKYDDQAAGQQAFYKEKFMELDSVVESLNPGRAKSLAITKLEEAYMWVGKALRDEQIARGNPVELQEERKNG